MNRRGERSVSVWVGRLVQVREEDSPGVREECRVKGLQRQWLIKRGLFSEREVTREANAALNTSLVICAAPI